VNFPVPLFYQQNISRTTKLAIWEIEEKEEFFLRKVPLQREITHPQKRLQHLAGRYLLPFLFDNFPYTEIEIADTRKPFLPNEQYHFSISHCNKFAAAIASSDCRVGVDVEFITPRLEKIKHKFLHPEELRFVNSRLHTEQLNLLSILWSAKEAMYKWYGAGSVDFTEMMRTFPFRLQREGNIEAAFMKGAFQKKLLLHYKCMKELTLVWVSS
jgi:phosphopantetheinyl transferase